MKESNLMQELKYIEQEESMKSCLLNLSEGKNLCTMEYPNFGDINVRVIGLNLSNIYHRAVHVEILDEGLQKEETYSEEVSDVYGIMENEPTYVTKTRKVPVRDEWVNIEWLKNYRDGR